MFPETTVSLDALRALQLERLRGAVRHAYDNQAPYRAKCVAAGIHPDDIDTGAVILSAGGNATVSHIVADGAIAITAKHDGGPAAYVNRRPPLVVEAQRPARHGIPYDALVARVPGARDGRRRTAGAPDIVVRGGTRRGVEP